MENLPNWGLKLSLQQMALRRLATNVWSEFDILTLIENYQFDSLSEETVNIWQETVENEVKVKVSKLMLPKLLMKQLLHLVRPMGLDILKWKIFQEQMLCYGYFNRHILEQLCWTSAGMVDYRNTAKRLVLLEMFDIWDVYNLACSYCLDDYIADIWSRIPNYSKSIYFDKAYSEKMKYVDIRFTWSFIVTQASKVDHMFYRNAFKRAAYLRNITATEYFFQKIPVEEQESCAFLMVSEYLNYRNIGVELNDNLSFPTEKSSEVLNYLVSQMSPKLQMVVLKVFPFIVLRCFLNWPWPDLFLDIADTIWTFLPESCYDRLQSLFIVNFRDSDYYSPNFFQEFFLRSPSNFRKQFVFRCDSLFPDFFRAEDTETIKVVFRNLGVEDRVKLVSDYKFFELLDSLISTDKCHLVELCLREATLSKEQRQTLKGDFMGFVTGADTHEVRLRKHNWAILFESLNETDVNAFNKRNSEFEMLTKAKKPCYE